MLSNGLSTALLVYSEARGFNTREEKPSFKCKLHPTLIHVYCEGRRLKDRWKAEGAAFFFWSTFRTLFIKFQIF